MLHYVIYVTSYRYNCYAGEGTTLHGASTIKNWRAMYSPRV